MSLRSAQGVNIRTGPGIRYPVQWVLKRPGLPVKIVAEYDVWRQIEDVSGDKGWIHSSLLSGLRTGILIQKHVAYRKPDGDAIPEYIVEAGVVGRLLRCQERWCRLKVDDHTGWVLRSAVWGVFPDEEINE